MTKLKRIVTRLQGLCSTTADTVGPLPIIDCESCIGFIGGGKSHVTSSSCSISWFVAADWELVKASDDLALLDDPLFEPPAPLLLLLLYSSSVVVLSDGNLNILSEPFLTNGRSAAVLSTFPWDSFLSGGGSHFRLKKIKKKY